MLALSVREAMEQAVASLRTGHVTVGMDVGMHGGHSTDGKTVWLYIKSPCKCSLCAVLPEASQYKAKEEFTTLGERIKQVSKEPRVSYYIQPTLAVAGHGA